MSRRRAAVKREVLPDPKFGDDRRSTKFMNCLMYEGKKSVAERIVYGAFDRIQKRSGQDPIRVFHEALTMSRRPSRCARAASAARPIRCRSRSVPTAAQALAIRWLIIAARAAARRTRWRSGCRANCSTPPNNRGVAVKKREDTHRMAEANKAFSHYRW